MIRHRLATADLLAVAGGPVSTELVDRLRAAELSRHHLLVEAVRRRALRRGRRADVSRLEWALTALSRLQRRRPDLVRGVLRRPQVGGWANSCLRALGSGRRVDVAYLTRLVEEAIADAGRERAPAVVGPMTSQETGLRITAGGIGFNVLLDYGDPYLDLYGPRVPKAGREEVGAWRERLAGGWRLIVRYDRSLAEAIAAAVTTLVPLREGTDHRPRSATSGWAFGAVAMSLPPDDPACADTLVHEFRHLLLGAISDLIVLVRPVTGILVYSPWREDPRPLPGLLFGSHAYVGLLDFWRRQNSAEAAAKHARWLEPTSSAVDTLASSHALTNEGTLLVGAMRRNLTGWRAAMRHRSRGPAEEAAKEAAADHRLRWRLRHLRPDKRALDALADARLANDRPPAVPTRVDAEPAPGLGSGIRSLLLESRLLGGSGGRPRRSPGKADQAFLDGRYGTAAHEYKMRIAAGRDADAWVGLALCRLHDERRAALRLRPEVAAGLHDRLRVRTGRSYDPDRLGAWLSTA